MFEKHLKGVVFRKAEWTIYPEVGYYRRKMCISLLIVFLHIFKYTPLTEAARNDHTDIASLLIENGADVNEGSEVR